jgi:oxygen-independent coproporphyrinogen III oxidase
MIQITPELIQKFSKPGPRYTSYPTAPEWKIQPDSTVYTQALTAFGQTDKPVSVYVHIPFCASMCYYCGCNVVIRKSRAEVGDEYLDYLEKEVALVRNAIGRRPHIKQFHVGGGTPNYLSCSQLRRLKTIFDHAFIMDPDAEVAIEIDPRTVTLDQVQVLREIGFNRVSMGIQDFDPDVQNAVNRVQPYELVERLIAQLKQDNWDSINMDLIYGLPHQTRSGFKRTIDQVIALAPDRIAMYSFAHIPWLKSHQKLISESALPNPAEKLAIFVQARDQFLQNGYDAIAMDHFAKSDDAMARAFQNGVLHRNFMGYTLKPADEFLGFGVTSIGFVENTFTQNNHELADYYHELNHDKLPAKKGLALTKDDQIRAWVITALMCQFQVNKSEFKARFAQDFDTYFATEQSHLDACERDELIIRSTGHIQATELGRFFIRNVAMGFDWYLRQSKTHQRYSSTI